MFDIGWSELLVIGVVALIAIGPKELPGALRALGQWMTKIRRMAADFQNQFQEALREAEMADIKKQVETLSSGFDPIDTARKQIESAMEDKPPSALATAAEPSAGSAISSDAPSAYAPPESPPVGQQVAPAEPSPAESEKALAGDVASGGKPGDRPV
jgi:sec-independent protein translocase protein TatB